MALLRYLKPRDGLPDPRGSLSSSMPSQAIAQANREVQEAIQSDKGKRGPYKKYSPTVRAEIGKYAYHHGVAAAARFFSRRLDKKVSETTVRSIKSAYRSVLFYHHSVSIFSVPWLSLTYEYLSNSCLPDFPINVVATHAQSPSIFVHLSIVALLTF